jgi:hypothetical protein
VIHIMLDLETLSTRYNARILAIGAVMFDDQHVYNTFYQPVLVPDFDTLTEAVALADVTDNDGFHIAKSTIDWWETQSDSAKAVFNDPEAVLIRKALLSFTQWIMAESSDIADVRMWGNGAGFDNVILGTAYDLCSMMVPWKFYNDRCYRTVKSMYPSIKLQRLGVHHNALADAQSQAQHLLAMGAYLGK